MIESTLNSDEVVILDQEKKISVGLGNDDIYEIRSKVGSVRLHLVVLEVGSRAKVRYVEIYDHLGTR